MEGNLSSLGQALGPHLNTRSQQHYADGSYRLSSPTQQMQASTSSHPAMFAPNGGGPLRSPTMKRKQSDHAPANLPQKRRRDPEDDYDGEGGAGSKHWSDEEKSKLFTWLMGPGNDDHWNNLRATKNSCLRDCAQEVFAGKKTYQALKGCYERNCHLWRQLDVFQEFNTLNGYGSIQAQPEKDRLREHERRIQAAHKAGVEIGNLNARVVDHWFMTGWFQLFASRHERGVLRPSDSHQLTAAPNGSGTQDVEPEDPGMEDEPPVEYHEPPMNTLTMHTLPHSLMQSYVGPSTLTSRESVTPTVTTATSGIPPVPSTPSTSHLQDQSSVTVNVTNTVLQQYMEFLRTQTQYSRMKLEYLRRREEREERDRMERRELERQRLDREAQNEFEYKKTVALSKEKADRAIQVLGNVAVDATIKQYASDYLKKMFASD